MNRARRSGFVAVLTLACIGAGQQTTTDASRPGSRVVMDAHNCYPYGEWWHDRIDRALSAGTPLAIEQDLFWFTDPRTGRSSSLLSHDPHANGNEPTMREYFFERVRPIVERALRDGQRSQWPLITLNLDLKSDEPEHLRAIWKLLSEYENWITTAPRRADRSIVQPLEVKPILVLTGLSDAQQAVFYDEVPVGGKLLVFGAVHTGNDPMAAPEILEPEPAENYRRWWNNSWAVVEKGGAEHAGEWNEAKNIRLRELVRHAHAHHLWIRFYTLDGATSAQLSCNGWFRGYNFGSLAAAEIRWKAARDAGADYIASDQYEQLGALLHGRPYETTIQTGRSGGGTTQSTPLNAQWYSISDPR